MNIFTVFLSNVVYFLSAQTTTEKLDTFMTAACRAHEFNGVVFHFQPVNV
jgi:hypothetical protein